MSEIKPIETKYKGYRFRSRLEARWAVFFDALNIRYEYEAEGFDLSSHPTTKKYLGEGNHWYLPDFFLPDYGYYVEIKPDLPEGDDLAAKKCASLAFVGKPIILIYGSPGRDSYSIALFSVEEQPISTEYVFAEGRKCDRLWLVSDAYQLALNCKTCSEPKCGDKMTGAHLGLQDAYDAARSARFE